MFQDATEKGSTLLSFAQPMSSNADAPRLRAAWPNGRVEHIDSFQSEAEINDWISRKSDAWLKPKLKAARQAGDAWLWIATDADTKLVPSWFAGSREADSAIIFMEDLASRLANRVQLTSDGHRPYFEAVEGAFGADIDYAMLVKIDGTPDTKTPERRYALAECIGCQKQRVQGEPDPKHISTSFAERNNLNVRIHGE